MSGEKKRIKVGLALGSGVARGLAHIGVLKEFERAGIQVDVIAGASMGALVGAFYANGMPPAEIEKLAIKLGAKRLNFLFDPSVPKTGLVKGKKISETLKTIIDDMRFSDLKLPFTCVATDIDTGEEVVLNEGVVWEALRASCSIPVMFAVVNMNGRHLVDGGLVNPVPVSLLSEMGADFVIAVNVIPLKEMPSKTEPNIFTVVMRTVQIAEYQMIKPSLKGADIVIEPDTTGIGYGDFHRAEECIRLGEEAAKKAIRKIKRRLRAAMAS